MTSYPAQPADRNTMHTHTLAIATALVAASAGFGGSALATPVTLNFEGTVSQAQFDPFDPLNGAVGPGSPLYTYLNFDTAVVDADASPNLGSYTLSGGAYGLAALIGPILFPIMHSVNISVVNGIGGAPDQYAVFAWEGTAGGLGDYFSMSILLQDDSGTVFDSDALPVGLPDIGRFDVSSFDISGQYTNLDGQFIQYEVLGDISPAATVPEPAALSLVSLALLGCVGATLRQRR